ncbi:MAG: c-type cytochrome, partial [Myxococcota bacterium]
CYYAWKYRRRSADQKTSPLSHSLNIELGWTIPPVIGLALMFLFGFRAWVDINVPPPNAMEVQVSAWKWGWKFTYTVDETSFSTNHLYAPQGRPVKLIMSSSDVIHSFYLPEFRIKRDVLPNRRTVLWFNSKHATSRFVSLELNSAINALEAAVNKYKGGGVDAFKALEKVLPTLKGEMAKRISKLETQRALLKAELPAWDASLKAKAKSYPKAKQVALRKALWAVAKAIRGEPYNVFCTEYCGQQHSMMTRWNFVYTPEEFERWVAAKVKDANSAKPPHILGKELYAQVCSACHSQDGSRLIGPSFKGRYGTEVGFVGGAKAKMDAAYIRESILYPNKKIALGYPANQMPSYKGQLTDVQIRGLIAYIRKLNGKGK